MRDFNRIDRILNLIEQIWKTHPDFRLCQLIQTCFQSSDLYYKEDEELEERLQLTFGVKR
jgi:uncharacterized protein YihD (DUF1040 family)